MSHRPFFDTAKLHPTIFDSHCVLSMHELTLIYSTRIALAASMRVPDLHRLDFNVRSLSPGNGEERGWASVTLSVRRFD